MLFLVATSLFATSCNGASKECQTDADCNDATLECRDGACSPRCEGVECDLGLECDAITGECVLIECVNDGDCDHETMECRESRCTPKCEGVECDAGQVCETTSGSCAPAPCESDSECGEETLECREGLCTPKCEGVDCGSFAACHPATGQCIDSGDCLENTHCIPETRCMNGRCRNNLCGPPENRRCEDSVGCEPGTDCVSTPAGAYCLEPCTSHVECESGWCEEQESSTIYGYCRSRRGQPAEYFGPCDAHGTLDGRCVGPFEDSDVGHYGFCHVVGDVPHWGECMPNSHIDAANPADSAVLCDGHCLEFEDEAFCSQWCTFWGADLCSGISESETFYCHDQQFNGFGFCNPLREDIGFEGDSCDPSFYDTPLDPSLRIPCIDGTYCAEEGGRTVCMRACSTLVEEGEAACQDPDKTCVTTGFSEFVGVCRCSEGFADCGEGCVPLNTIERCGACDVACEPALNASPVCTPNGCSIECNEGYSSCDGDYSTGCETEGEC